MVGSSLRMDSPELRRFIELYDLETYLFETVSKNFEQKQTLTTFEFFAIITWKSNRSKTKVRDGLAAAGKSASDLMSDVGQAEKAETKVEVLRGIDGIGLPIASAILAVCYPDEFTVLDVRAWTTLRDISAKGLPSRYPQEAGDYLRYCQVCRDLASEAGLSLRNLDRALWAKNWEDNLRAFIMGTR